MIEDTFGKKLEEARTRQGISIRDAADATKIRSDFLISFENEHGNFNMPDVYKRGFIKLYARFLKLDPDAIVQEFDQYQRQNRKPKKSEEIYNPSELPGEQGYSHHAEENQTTLPLQTPAAATPIHVASDPEAVNRPAPSTPTSQEGDQNKALYMKIGLIFGGTLAFFTATALLISNLVTSPEEDYVANAHSPAIEQAEAMIDEIAENSTKEHFVEQLVLKGDDTIHVVVQQTLDKKRLFTGMINPNEPKTISRKGPVKVRFSDGSKLTIEKPDGNKVRPGRQGMGWIEI